MTREEFNIRKADIEKQARLAIMRLRAEYAEKSKYSIGDILTWNGEDFFVVEKIEARMNTSNQIDIYYSGRAVRKSDFKPKARIQFMGDFELRLYPGTK
jgi:hypothetical protein